MKNFYELLIELWEYLKYKISKYSKKNLKPQSPENKNKDKINIKNVFKDKKIKDDVLYQEQLKIEYQKIIKPNKVNKILWVIILLLIVFIVLFLSTDNNEDVLRRIQTTFSVLGV